MQYKAQREQPYCIQPKEQHATCVMLYESPPLRHTHERASIKETIPLKLFLFPYVMPPPVGLPCFCLLLFRIEPVVHKPGSTRTVQIIMLVIIILRFLGYSRAAIQRFRA